MKKVPCVWSEDLGCSNEPSVPRRVSLPEPGEAGTGSPAGVGPGWALLCFPAQLSALS